MGFVQRVGNLDCDIQDLRDGKRAAGNFSVEAFAFDVLHRDIVHAFGFTDLVDMRGVGVRQCRRRPRLLQESMQPLLIARDFCREDLQRDGAIQLRVTSQVNLAHPALAMLRADFIPAEFCSRSQRHVDKDLAEPGILKTGVYYLKPVIKTTSRFTTPRERASCCPSRDQAKLKIRSLLKSVSCLGDPPSIGWAQMFETPFVVTT